MKFLNIKNFNTIDQIQLILVSSLLILAIYLSFTGGYGVRRRYNAYDLCF